VAGEFDMGDVSGETGLGDIDPRLLDEALRRASRTPAGRTADPRALLQAILEEARRGTRDMHGLVAAAERMK
jgi:hypothetical protein